MKLISEWGTVENLLGNTDSLKGALQRKIVDNAEQIRFSKFLATIKTDVPVDIPIDNLRRGDIDLNTLTGIYTELEFRTFIKRLHDRHGDNQPLAPTPEAKPATTNECLRSSTSSKSLLSKPTHRPWPTRSMTTPPIPTSRLFEATIDEAVKAGRVGVTLYAIGSDDMTSRWMGTAISTSEEKPSTSPCLRRSRT